MASSFSLAEDIDVIKEYYPFELKGAYTPMYHIGPYKPGLVITADEPELIQQMHFSLVPTFFKEPKSLMCNAKSSHLFSKTVFKQLMIANKRCLIIADGFYLWQRFGPDKFPFRFILKDRPVFTFAGLWSAWIDPETAARYESFCMVTVPANPLVRNIRKSMPLILTKEDEQRWLSKSGAENLPDICLPYPEKLMTKFLVSRELADRSINDDRLFKPLNSVKTPG